MAEKKFYQGEFSGPPDGAPHEVAADLSPDLIAQQLARAQANEKVLAPFDPPKGPTPPPAAIVLTDAPPAPQAREVSPASDLNAAARALSEARAARQAGNTQPAASDSDSPSRGIPKPVFDEGKKITGGFGHVGEAQYYPINGDELHEIVKGMVDSMLKRIANDLRFSMAITYPRLICDLTLTFKGWAADVEEQVKVVKTHEQTPAEIAGQFGQAVVFVVQETKSEFDQDGEPLDPPDRMRDGAGLPKPQKQLVGVGTGRMLVDIVPLGNETF